MCKEKRYKAPALDVCDQLGGGAGRENVDFVIVTAGK